MLRIFPHICAYFAHISDFFFWIAHILRIFCNFFGEDPSKLKASDEIVFGPPKI